jgi:hypothetical protein
MDANEAAKILGQKGGKVTSEKKRKAILANLEKARAIKKEKSQGGGGVNNSVSQSDAGLQTSPSQAHRD